MRWRIGYLWAAIALVTFTVAAASAEEAESGELSSVEQRASYGLGFNLGKQWSQQNLPLDLDLLVRGLREGFGGGDGLLTDAEIGTALQEMSTRVMNEVGQRNLEEGQAFLAGNAQREGVTVTDSGLQYEVLADGEGPSPSATDQVTVHYRGTLIDGTVFDSSIDRGEPMTFPLNRVVAGWTEALQLMKVGSKWKLYLPAELAYGAQGTPNGPIGPNAALIFEVELLSIGG